MFIFTIYCIEIRNFYYYNVYKGLYLYILKEVFKLDFLERLILYMKENNIRQADIVKKANGAFTRGYVSNVINKKRYPNVELLTVLSEMSGKSINWWSFGKDNYEWFDSLSELVKKAIKDGEIQKDKEIPDKTLKLLHAMLDKELEDIKDEL